MKIHELEAYFQKKIAKTIPYDVLLCDDEHDRVHYYFAVEPVSVSDSLLHVTVAFRFKTRGGRKGGVPQYCGETDIPLRDGDPIERILNMAKAGSAFGEGFGPMCEDGHTQALERARERLKKRLEQHESVAPPPGP